MKELNEIDLKLIEEHPDNPRTTWDAQKVKELSESIATHGIIQPVTVRLHPDWTLPNSKIKYQLVCGSRRLRASKLIKQKTIPALIRDLTDEQVFEIQMIENLHREDINPMDEAVALKRMKEHNYSLEEISKKMGKSEKYVAQRMKLNDLSDNFKAVLLAGKILITHAYAISRINQTDQEQVFNQYFNRWQDENFDPRRTGNIENVINNSMLKLANATFDTEDSSLVKNVPACSICPKNTACNSLLFPDMVDDPRCTDRRCFEEKQASHMNAMINVAKEDPNIIPLHYQYDHDTKWKEAAEKQGLKMFLNKYNDVEMINEPREPEPPEKPDYEGISQEEEEELRSDYEQELLDYQSDLNEYYKEKEEYTRLMKDPTVLKGFHVTGGEAGKMVPIKLKQSATKAIDPNNSDAERKLMIAQIKEKEQRACELDQEKIHRAVVDQLSENPLYTGEDRRDLKPCETPSLAYLIYDYGDYGTQEQIRKELGFRIDDAAEFFKKNNDSKMIGYLCRMAILQKWHNHLPFQNTGKLLRHTAEGILEEGIIPEIENQVNQKAAARKKRVQDRLDELEVKQKKGLSDLVGKKQKKGLSELLAAD